MPWSSLHIVHRETYSFHLEIYASRLIAFRTTTLWYSSLWTICGVHISPISEMSRSNTWRMLNSLTIYSFYTPTPKAEISASFNWISDVMRRQILTLSSTNSLLISWSGIHIQKQSYELTHIYTYITSEKPISKVNRLSMFSRF